jgi:hypothetical protein
MNYYHISTPSRTLYKDKEEIISFVSGEQLSAELKKLCLSISNKEFPENPPVFSPFTPKEYKDAPKRKHPWELFHFDVNSLLLINLFNGFLVNKKVKDTLEKLKILSEYKFYPAELITKTQTLEKYLFVWKIYTPSPEEMKQWEWKHIVREDYKITYKKKYTGEPITDLKHFQKMTTEVYKKSREQLLPSKLVFETKFDFAENPFFEGFGYTTHKILSQGFKNKIEAAGITGFGFEKITYKIEIREK